MVNKAFTTVDAAVTDFEMRRSAGLLSDAVELVGLLDRDFWILVAVDQPPVQDIAFRG